MATALDLRFSSRRRAPRKTAALVAIALHVIVGYALISHEPARSVLFAAAPITVELIRSPKIEPTPKPPVEVALPPKPPVEAAPPPKPEAKPTPKPKPKRTRRPRPSPPKPQPMRAAPSEAPAPMEPPAPNVPPAPLAQPPARPAPAPVAVAPAPAPAPLAATPPVFNAAYLENPPPAYPALSRRLGEEGRVILRVLVNAAGRADEVQIDTSSGHARLDEAARETVRDWRFVPAKRGEQPLAAWVSIPISFKLEG